MAGNGFTHTARNIRLIALVLCATTSLSLFVLAEDVVTTRLPPSLPQQENEEELAIDTHIVDQCVLKCPEQNRTNGEHVDVGCPGDCYIQQCAVGCRLWEKALDSSCQSVCNKTEQEELEPKEMYCVIGCNEALNRYFNWLKAEVGTPSAPALVADSLTAKSLSLEWALPERLAELTRGKSYSPRTYLVQWRYEEMAGDWKFCRNQSMGENSTVRVENLLAYTKYRFRVALLLSPKHHDEVLVSEQSVIISTLSMGAPLSEPAIVRAVAVDHTRISVSWEPGPFPNGPVLSYVLLIKDLAPVGYSALKDIPASDKSNYYMFEKLSPSRNYSVSVAMRNAEGEGPPASMVVATPAQQVRDDEPQPTLILGAEYSVLTQGSDFLAEPPQVFYSSDHKIMGLAVHIARKLIFVSDAAGYIYQAPLETIGPKSVLLSPESGMNFLPKLLSIDWLNDHLYILGEVVHPDEKRVWQISRCTLDGRSLTVAYAGIASQPAHIEVDSFNGYLYWVIGGRVRESGLYRLDLGDVSNGIKHEITPLQILKRKNLGAFAVDHTRFRLLVPAQDANTVLSVSLDGKDTENIRKNTQSPRFHVVKSLAMANGLFYWTNGEEVMTEEYHKFQKDYFHNVYPDLSNRTFVSVFVNLPSAQPIPVPVNPPSNVQALLSARRAKVSWRVPHLLGNQGKGAWQDWHYELEVLDDENRNGGYRDIRRTFHFIEALKPNTNYTFRVAAYTRNGRGPWSTEFRTNTLKSQHDRYLIWSSNDGLLQSDVIGEHIHPLVGRAELGDHLVTDIAWFEDVIYFVSNSTLRFYNRTNGLMGRLGEIESVESIAVDWIGRRLYWSNPTQQLITRGHLNGDQQEPLPILVIARELKIDALNGFIYYSTGHAVETCRLNGKNRTSYYSVHYYSSKEVMGLTLSMDSKMVFWIVRSYESSSLFSAPMAGVWSPDKGLTELVLQERSLHGPLTHFSDRLLWLQDNMTVIVGNMSGKNLAHIKNTKLTGLKAISVIDPTHHICPLANSRPINVIPEAVDNSTIRVSGHWRAFNISWRPVASVNYGQVFYEIRLHATAVPKDVVREVSVPQFAHHGHTLQPYSALEITIRAFTFWGSSPAAKAQRHSPADVPSVPTNPRVFVTRTQSPLSGELSIRATYRWDVPAKPNGPILAYKVYCGPDTKDVAPTSPLVDGEIVHENLMEKIVVDLRDNTTYTFQIQASTEVGVGEMTAPLRVSTAKEKPVPRVLIASQDKILAVDLDLQKSIQILATGTNILHIGHITNEELLVWINENNEVISFHKRSKQKLLTIGARVHAFTVDWVERIFYWSQAETATGGSSVHAFSLNNYEIDRQTVSHEIVTRPQSVIVSLIVSPLDRTLFWIEVPDVQHDEGHVWRYNIDTHIATRFENALSNSCMNRTEMRAWRNLALDTTNKNDRRIIWSLKGAGIYSTSIRTQICRALGVVPPKGLTSVAADSGHLYWLTDTALQAQRSGDHLHYQLNLSATAAPSGNGGKILSFFHQPFPERECLFTVQKYDFYAHIENETDTAFVVRLPEPDVLPKCAIKPPGQRYTIIVRKSIDNGAASNAPCQPPSCQNITAFSRVTHVTGLHPFTAYTVRIGVNSYYGTRLGKRTVLGPPVECATLAGVPSKPRHVASTVISPTEAILAWLPPAQLNADSVWYEVHWQTENALNGVKNRQEQVIADNAALNDTITMSLTHLVANQTYSVWVRAYSSNRTFADSNAVQIRTFAAPNNITLVRLTPYTITLTWQPPHEHIRKYMLEYYTGSGGNEPIVCFDSDVDGSDTSDTADMAASSFTVTNLQPKSQYKFAVRLYYEGRVSPYQWPGDNRFVFETAGDCPSMPGRPLVNHVTGDVYKVAWEPAKENGATIEEYGLESLRLHTIANRIARSTPTSSSSFSSLSTSSTSSFSSSSSSESDSGVINYTMVLPSSSIVAVTDRRDEPLANDDTVWHLQYNGTDAYWIVKDLKPIHMFSFRVRARNAFGWGDYSNVSEPLSEAYVPISWSLPFAAILILAGMIAVLLFAGVCLRYCACCRPRPDKKSLQDVSLARTSVELANLNQLPFGRNFVQANNLLYSVGIVDTEFSILPQIKREQITMTSFLGSGAFGEVYEGVVHNVSGAFETRVAIKTLRKGANEQEKSEFLQEAQLMSNFKHDHILKLIGVCLDFDALYIIMELMQGGDLLSFLRQNRPVAETASPLTMLDLLSMCVDVAFGCRYLEEMHFVHRDLACRNCLVSSVDPQNRVVKIGDFGLARDIYKNDYYRKEGEGLLPVRWMSPESLVDGVFTSLSDIWAFGVLCWEIMTLGQQPYPARNNVEVLHYVRNGGRLGRPSDCPDDLYQLMMKCWSYSPDERPSFRYCLEVLKDLRDANAAAGVGMPIMAISETNRASIGTLKLTNNNNNNNNNINNIKPVDAMHQHDNSLVITPTSSCGSMHHEAATPKYLELIYDNHDEQPSSIVSEEYETPITDFINNNAHTLRAASKVVLPPKDEFSSGDELLPDTEAHRFYTNTPLPRFDVSAGACAYSEGETVM